MDRKKEKSEKPSKGLSDEEKAFRTARTASEFPGKPIGQLPDGFQRAGILRVFLMEYAGPVGPQRHGGPSQLLPDGVVGLPLILGHQLCVKILRLAVLGCFDGIPGALSLLPRRQPERVTELVYRLKIFRRLVSLLHRDTSQNRFHSY